MKIKKEIPMSKAVGRSAKSRSMIAIDVAPAPWREYIEI
jgi:hypothetical protein